LCYPVGVFGFLNIRKPPGPTSHDLVDQVRRAVRPLVGRTKVGHAGTLDPFAEGVLVMCLGAATRLAEYVQRRPKRYLAEVTLGATSTTDDREGEVTPQASAAPPTVETVAEAVRAFVGRIEQVPPAHSAVHVDGRRAYELARAGERTELPPRQVDVHELRIVEYAWPLLRLDVRCGSGTYVRALARDIGAALGVGGFCSALTRSEVGSFTLSRAVEVEKLDFARDLVSPAEALDEMQRITADDRQAGLVRRGMAVEAPHNATDGEAAVIDAAGALVAIALVDARAGVVRPVKVFAGA
jgi:tRNA pseudouridine55 synthase